MKYESNILERLINTYGVVGNPKYVSEIIKQFIIQGKECYPNLFTYQSDWLAHIDEFGLTNDYVVTYTGQRFYAPNTKESPVKRAILTGQTLVNVKPKTPTKVMGTETAYDENTGVCSFNTNKGNLDFSNTLLKPSTKYLTVVEIIQVPTYVIEHNFPLKITLGNLDEKFININKDELQVGIVKKTMTTSSNIKDNLTLSFRGEFSTPIKFKVMILEYQDGMENWDIPYFEGMQSVKLPVLTTSNEDGTKTNILTVNEDVTLRSNGSVCDELDLLTGKLTQRIDEDGEILTQEVVKTVDLNIKDQNNQVANHLTSFEGGTHFDTSSQTGSVLPTLVVDVVVDLEETLKTCSLEGNTM